MADIQETIFALSSAPGKAGVAVIRVSGPQAFESVKILTNKEKAPEIGFAALHNICHPAQSQPKEGAPPPSNILCKNNMTNVPRGTFSTGPYGKIGDKLIDKALVLPFKAPRSFTGEDVVEYHCHGSPAVVQAMLDALAAQDGHRLAQPGEFTRRAFENGKMDLTEAEAVADLIDAETEAQRLLALDQMGGVLSALYNGWAEGLKKALAYIEAVIDFPDEDVPDDQIAQARPALEEISREMASHLSDGRRGERLRAGVQVAVIGAPNAGKSSLVNALVERDVAIVSDMAGTTRDVIEVHLDIGGYPVILADTAGLRPDQIAEDGGHGSVESEGIRRALERARTADIRLIMFDATAGEIDSHSRDLIDENAIVVLNKSDQNPAPAWLGELGESIISISVSQGQGLDQLLEILGHRLATAFHVPRGTPSLTRQRHRQNVELAHGHLAEALSGMDAAALPELIAEDVRLTVRALGRVTGRVDAEDLLDVIFKDFCIGK